MTGASGFIGSQLRVLLNSNPKFSLTSAVRSLDALVGNDVIKTTSIDSVSDWTNFLIGQHCVIHIAAKAHVVDDFTDSFEKKVREINVCGTLNLARQAASCGVSRFIFISSIGVNGTINTKPFTELDIPNPSDIYAKSKYDAEVGLLEIQKKTQMEVVIIRPPLVYGPNAPGNFGLLVKYISRGLPLPLGFVNNKRTFISLENLVDLITTCIDHPNAANQIFLAGDGQDISTTELIKSLAKAMGKSSCLIPIPAFFLKLLAILIGKKHIIPRLLGSLQVDISKARKLLGWSPPLTIDEGIHRCFVSSNESYSE